MPNSATVLLAVLAVLAVVLPAKPSGSSALVNECLERATEEDRVVCSRERYAVSVDRSEVVTHPGRFLKIGQTGEFVMSIRDAKGRAINSDMILGTLIPSAINAKAGFKTDVSVPGTVVFTFFCPAHGHLGLNVEVRVPDGKGGLKRVHMRGSPALVTCDSFVPSGRVIGSLLHRDEVQDDEGLDLDRVAFVTLVTNNEYVVGALVLAWTLRNKSGSSVPVVVLVTEFVSEEGRAALARAGLVVKPVPIIKNPTRVLLSGPAHSAWSDVYTKLHVWSLTEYKKVVFLDADMLVLKDLRHLFAKPELSAAPEFAGSPLAFNAGLMVLAPSKATYKALTSGLSGDSLTYDGADQGYLNEYFLDRWNLLPGTYNLLRCPNHYLGSDAPQVVWFHNYHFERAQVLHLTGPKPWLGRCGRYHECVDAGHMVPVYTTMWWLALDAMKADHPWLQVNEQYDDDHTLKETITVRPKKEKKGKAKAGSNKPKSEL
jgi:lipopolysaccharide biosynthesis glycosyltransferase